MSKNQFLILSHHIFLILGLIYYGFNFKEVQNLQEKLLINNKIYECGKTYIITQPSKIKE